MLVLVLAGCAGGDTTPTDKPARADASAVPRSGEAAPTADPGSTDPDTTDSNVADSGRTDSGTNDLGTTEDAEPPVEDLDDWVDIEEWSAWGPFLLHGNNLSYGGRWNLHVPTVGEVALEATNLLPGEEIDRESYMYLFDGDRSLVAGLVQVRQPASGLQPERWEMSVIGVDVSTGTPQLLGRLPLQDDGDRYSPGGNEKYGFVGTTDSGVIVVARAPAAAEDGRDVMGVDVVNGTVVWERADGGHLNGEDGFFDSADMPMNYAMFEAATPEDDVDFLCARYRYSYSWVELGSGEDVPIDLPAGRADDACSVEAVSVISDRFVQFAQEADVDGTYRYVPLGVVDTSTGDSWMPPELGIFRDSDPLTTLVKSHFYEPYIGWVDDLVLTDLATGEETLRVAEDVAQELSLEDVSFHDGLLYLATSDEQFVIDARTGDEIGPWTEHPVALVGSHTLLDDGRLVVGWTYSEGTLPPSDEGESTDSATSSTP